MSDEPIDLDGEYFPQENRINFKELWRIAPNEPADASVWVRDETGLCGFRVMPYLARHLVADHNECLRRCAEVDRLPRLPTGAVRYDVATNTLNLCGDGGGGSGASVGVITTTVNGKSRCPDCGELYPSWLLHSCPLADYAQTPVGSVVFVGGLDYGYANPPETPADGSWTCPTCQSSNPADRRLCVGCRGERED